MRLFLIATLLLVASPAYAKCNPLQQRCPQYTVAVGAPVIADEFTMCNAVCFALGGIFGGYYVEAQYPTHEIGTAYNLFQYPTETTCSQTAQALCHPRTNPRRCDVFAMTRGPQPFVLPFPSGTVYVTCP